MTSASRGLIPGLAITETVSWGILYYAFPVLGAAAALTAKRALSGPRPIVDSGLSLSRT
jgi:hypothetical protein